MQPDDQISKRLSKNAPKFSVFIPHTTPRLRNHLHNQAIKRAKANIGIRRFRFDSGDSTALASPLHTDVQTIWAKRYGSQPTAYRRAQNIMKSPNLTVTTGGLRGDPFGAFPVTTDGCVASAVDYFLQHYAPVHINPKKEDLTPADSSSLSKRYFALALEHVSMFELVITLSKAAESLRKGFAREPTKDVRIHYGKGVEALRLKMATNITCDDDATIMSVMALLGIALIYNDFASFETHLVGLRQLIDMRGGLDKLGWEGFLKNSIVGLESIWAYHENKKLTISSTELTIKLKYPTHPFPPDLCAVIAKLPTGFSELSLSGVLSLQVISLLSKISFWTSQLDGRGKKGALMLGEPNGTYVKQAHGCLELLGLPTLSFLERLLCVALVACSLETYNRSTQRNPVHQRLMESLTENLNLQGLQKSHEEFIMWIALVIAWPDREAKEDSPEGGFPSKSRNILLDDVVSQAPQARNWKLVKRWIQNYFWSDQLLVRWKRVWDSSLLRYARKQHATRSGLDRGPSQA